jgi:hypothetical protein|tara:strand:+ start:369 stop:725 length:357 start_codon:yes stop_codon:yes gene_type:complete
MKKFLYFADGNGANLTGEAVTVLADNIKSIVPVTTTTTAMYFSDTDSVIDKIVFTHDDTTTTSGHRVREIAKAIAEAGNATAHINGLTDVVDLDNSIYYGNLSFITGLAITLGTSLDF